MDHQAQAPAEATRTSPKASNRVGYLVRHKSALLFLVLCATLVWRLNGTLDFWKSAWAQGTAFPDDASSSSIVGVAFQRSNQPFDLRKSTIPTKRILGGGPPKDGIPALTEPKQIAAQEATYLQADDRVIGVTIGGVARAYPLRILDYHEIVNDRIDDVPFAVTYCPLCDSAVVFDRRTKLGEREFGVSGLLYNSNVLMYDRGGQPESLWSQLMAEGVSGPAARVPLKTLPVELTTWQDWLSRNPQTTVLSPDTGHARNYGQRLYAAYFASPDLMFAVKPLNRRLPAKTPVLGVWTANAARAYPIAKFAGESRQISEQLDGKNFVLEYDAATRNLRVASAEDEIQWMYSFWFAWAAFRPSTELYSQLETSR